MKKLRVAIIGCGRISVVYAAALQNLAELAIPVLAVDKVKERAEAFAAQFEGCEASDETGFGEYEMLLHRVKPDLVHILLPHHLHEAYTTIAMRQGIHVLCEKPIGLNLAEADRMIEAYKKNAVQLGIIFQNRYIDGVQQLRARMADGTLGKLQGVNSVMHWHRPSSYYECDWKGRWQTEGGGVVIDQAIHSLDLVRYITGCEPVRVQAHTARRILTNIEVEDEADAAITLNNGTVYSFFACNYYTHNSPIRLEFDCENGIAQLVGDVVTIRWKDGREETIQPGSSHTVAKSESYWGSFHQTQIRACYTALTEGQPMPWAPEDARKTLALVQAIYTSARINGPVEL